MWSTEIPVVRLMKEANQIDGRRLRSIVARRVGISRRVLLSSLLRSPAAIMSMVRCGKLMYSLVQKLKSAAEVPARETFMPAGMLLCRDFFRE